MIRQRVWVDQVMADGDDFGAYDEVELRYDPADPLAVTMAFHPDDVEVAWSFARDLLLDGFRDRAGIGDVQVRRHGTRLYMRLESTEGEALLAFTADDIQRFLIGSLYLVPRGAERIDVDAALDDLLRSER